MDDQTIKTHARVALEGEGLTESQRLALIPRVESALRLAAESESLACERLASRASDAYFRPGAPVDDRFVVAAAIAAAIRMRRSGNSPF